MSHGAIQKIKVASFFLEHGVYELVHVYNFLQKGGFLGRGLSRPQSRGQKSRHSVGIDLKELGVRCRNV